MLPIGKASTSRVGGLSGEPSGLPARSGGTEPRWSVSFRFSSGSRNGTERRGVPGTDETFCHYERSNFVNFVKLISQNFKIFSSILSIQI